MLSKTIRERIHTVPTIEVTPAQLAAWDSGEPITKTRRRYIVVFTSWGNRGSNVYDVLTTQDLPQVGALFDVKGECRLIAKGPHTQDVGFVQKDIGGDVLAVTEIPV